MKRSGSRSAWRRLASSPWSRFAASWRGAVSRSVTRVSGERSGGSGCGTKKRTIFATEQERPDVALAREVWRAAQQGLDFASLVFVDETGTTTSMTRTYGWGHKGKPLLGRAPHGHWMTSTFVAGLQHD